MGIIPVTEQEKGLWKGEKRGIRRRQEKGMGWEALNCAGILPSFPAKIYF